MRLPVRVLLVSLIGFAGRSATAQSVVQSPTAFTDLDRLWRDARALIDHYGGNDGKLSQDELRRYVIERSYALVKGGSSSHLESDQFRKSFLFSAIDAQGRVVDAALSPAELELHARQQLAKADTDGHDNDLSLAEVEAYDGPLWARVTSAVAERTWLELSKGGSAADVAQLGAYLDRAARAHQPWLDADRVEHEFAAYATADVGAYLDRASFDQVLARQALRVLDLDGDGLVTLWEAGTSLDPRKFFALSGNRPWIETPAWIDTRAQAQASTIPVDVASALVSDADKQWSSVEFAGFASPIAIHTFIGQRSAKDLANAGAARFVKGKGVHIFSGDALGQLLQAEEEHPWFFRITKDYSVTDGPKPEAGTLSWTNESGDTTTTLDFALSLQRMDKDGGQWDRKLAYEVEDTGKDKSKVHVERIFAGARGSWGDQAVDHSLSAGVLYENDHEKDVERWTFETQYIPTFSNDTSGMVTGTWKDLTDVGGFTLTGYVVPKLKLEADHISRAPSGSSLDDTVYLTPELELGLQPAVATSVWTGWSLGVIFRDALPLDGSGDDHFLESFSLAWPLGDLLGAAGANDAISLKLSYERGEKSPSFTDTERTLFGLGILL
jgi:hypothetical protein